MANSTTRWQRATDRTIAWIHEYVGDLIVLVGCVLIGYLVVLLLPLSVQWKDAVATSPKDAIDIYAKSFAVALSSIGLAVAYRKYIRGRLFSERADLYLTARPVRWRSADGAEPAALLHEVTVQLRNTGTVAIWLPEITPRVLALQDDTNVGSAVGVGSLSLPKPLLAIEAVEPNAAYVCTYWFWVPASVAEFRVAIDVQSGRKTSWHRTLLAANAFIVGDDDMRERGDLSVTTRAVQREALPLGGGDLLLYELIASLRNVGNARISPLSLSLLLKTLDDDTELHVRVGPSSAVPPAAREPQPGVEPAASETLTSWFRIPATVGNFRVEVNVRSERGTRWRRTTIVSTAHGSGNGLPS